MKLNKNFLVHKTGSDTIVVPTAKAEFSGVIKGNVTLGAILDLIKEDTTEKRIIDSIAEEYDAPRETIEKDVVDAIKKLKSIGAVGE